MTQPVDTTAPAIGGCLNCRQIFLVTPGSANCLICGRPADVTLSFATARPEPLEAPGAPMTDSQYLDQVAGLEPLPVKEEELGEAPPSCLLPGEEEAELLGGLDLAIQNYLWGFTDSADHVGRCFTLAGADPETAATAVGRLAAVRELIAQLAHPQEEPKGVISWQEAIDHLLGLGYTQEEAEKKLSEASPPAEPAHVAPGAGSPPAQEEPDRTSPDSP